ncbi:FdhF/YdeP family oxidoreductase [Simiduia agarivorans]|uniref:Oxidoreductase alpha (Molybdopterin) subunit n=1 Tax=Simiduia agarivorans (strain DSM 21679 / JCM 13881 / BCRC 17597 / SA1) TaxID=1117647 RepID=K4KHP6_SIMAS|nr:FdhF/YdeP family oxidoreductase [Simiduia agarivorans]AFU98546.1 oxidoreductase alpha (molybdopterin) subunit [Simiduia agarivorans SA1 = DSM 21679]
MRNPSTLKGGGLEKVLYTLNTARKMGVTASAKALTANNACKACGLGMGGQRGGMTNEQGLFPSVCNKSVQAQSTDIQPEIPRAIFNHPLSELQQLDGYQVEHLGRLNTPLYKTAGADRLEPISWDQALAIARERFVHCVPERFFAYASGRSSMEAGFILQLLARAKGTNNVNNCSYFCHQATGVALTQAVGSGTASVQLDDLDHCDTVILAGANPASNHPRLIHKLRAVRERGGRVIVINPMKEPGLVRFANPKSLRSLATGGDAIATDYLQPKTGSDLWLFAGLAKTVLHLKKENTAFLHDHCENADAYCQWLDAISWQTIERHTGLAEADIQSIGEAYSESDRCIFAWGMGLTHHQHGVQTLEALVNLCLLRGQVGKAGAGLLPLRGHSNVQGMGSIGVKPLLSPDVMAKLEQQLGIAAPGTDGMDTMACLRAAHAGSIDMALIMGGNLLEAAPATDWAKVALERVGFKLYLTTTLNRGHLHACDQSEQLILPVCARDEEQQPTTQESMFSFVRLSDGGIHRLNNVKPEVDILAALGESLPDGASFTRLKNHQTLRATIAETIAELEPLADIDQTKTEFHIPGRHLNRPHFPTGNGRARFCISPLPDEHDATTARRFRLMTARSEGQFNTIVYEQKDSYRGMDHRRVILMNADDMRAQGLRGGQKISLQSDQGQVTGFEVYAFDLPRGCLFGYYPETNPLVGLNIDPRSKTPAYKSVLVDIQPEVI